MDLGQGTTGPVIQELSAQSGHMMLGFVLHQVEPRTDRSIRGSDSQTPPKDEPPQTVAPMLDLQTLAFSRGYQSNSTSVSDSLVCWRSFCRALSVSSTGPAAGSIGSLSHLSSLIFAAEQVKLIQDYFCCLNGRTDILKLDRLGVLL